MKSFFVILFLFFTNQIFAQVSVLGRDPGQGSLNTNSYGVMTEVRKAPSEIEGDTYLNSEWMTGSIHLINGPVISDKFIRYDIQMDQIEIKIDDKIKGIQGKNISRFTLINPRTQLEEVYVSAAGKLIDGVAIKGFLRLVEDGDWDLYAKTNVEVVKAAYVAAIDMGEDELSFVKKEKFYIAKSNELIEVVTNKKRLGAQLGVDHGKFLRLMKENKISLKEESDLKLLVSILNREGA